MPERSLPRAVEPGTPPAVFAERVASRAKIFHAALGYRACILRGRCYAEVVATKTKRTPRPGTRPLTTKQRELLVALRAAREKGENPAGVVYKAMSPEEKRAFVQLHAK